MNDSKVSTITADKVVDDLRILARDAEALLAATAGQADTRIEELRTRLNAALRSARGTCEELQGRTLDQVRRGLRETDEAVRSHPWESVGVAFGFGLVLGVLLSRR